MKVLILVVFAVFTSTGFGQTTKQATAIYASNGTMVGISDLVGLSDCKSQNVAGKLRKLKIVGDTATFHVKKKHQDAEVTVDLSRLATADRTMAIRDLIRKSNPIRVAGYTCGDEEVITAFSVERVY